MLITASQSVILSVQMLGCFIIKWGLNRELHDVQLRKEVRQVGGGGGDQIQGDSCYAQILEMN